MEKKKSFADNYLQGKTPTKEMKVEGVGTVSLYGKWDTEKLISRLMESDTITR